MSCILACDIGTTALKAVLLKDGTEFICERSEPLETIFGENGEKEQRPLDWYNAFCKASRSFFCDGILPEEVSAIVFCGQMQDLIPLDHAGLPQGNAILYSDGRAEYEAKEIQACIGQDISLTGNSFDGSMPFAKLLWGLRKRPKQYGNIYKVLFSPKDYVISRLTGQFVTDVTTAATTGLMDISGKCWKPEWLTRLGLDGAILPKLLYANQIAGTVTESVRAETGLPAGTPVYAGAGDAGAATLASGISSPGEYNMNIGTSGWIASISDGLLKREGVFNLAAVQQGKYINVVPFLNAGSAHKWIVSQLIPEDRPNPFGDFEKILAGSTPGSDGVLFLPYLNGERFPVMDADAKACFIGLSAATTKANLGRSVLEGVAFSVRQGIETLGRPSKLSLIGGGARSAVWCRIFADVLGLPVEVCGDSAYLSAMAMAFVAMKPREDEYSTLTGSLCQAVYTPDPGNAVLYNRAFEQYQRIYPKIAVAKQTKT